MILGGEFLTEHLLHAIAGGFTKELIYRWWQEVGRRGCGAAVRTAVHAASTVLIQHHRDLPPGGGVGLPRSYNSLLRCLCPILRRGSILGCLPLLFGCRVLRSCLLLCSCLRSLGLLGCCLLQNAFMLCSSGSNPSVLIVCAVDQLPPEECAVHWS